MRSYQMQFNIQDYKPDRQRAIVKAVGKEWPFETVEVVVNGEEISAEGSDSLYGAESEEEFADRIKLSIWKANTGPCHVSLRAVYLDGNDYSFDKDDDVQPTGETI